MRPLVPQGGNDRVYTPEPLAQLIVDHYKPSGRICEPCRGQGAFMMAFDNYFKKNTHVAGTVTSCEIDEGQDFFKLQEKQDWIITNPPWGQLRPFLQHSMAIADNVVFLVTVNHLFTKARLRDVHKTFFGMREMVHVPTPVTPWPQSGFALAAIHLKKGYCGPTYQTFDFLC